MVFILNVGRERDRCAIPRGAFPPKKKTFSNLALDKLEMPRIKLEFGIKIVKQF